MSDISSFAEWKAQQPAPPPERRKKRIDMTSASRIWADRDSSNEYRSSASEEVSAALSQSLSQRLAREAEDEDNHPPSSQPRLTSSSIGSVQTEDDDEVDDLLEDFDVSESEKEFLRSLLQVAPTEEVEALHGVTGMGSTEEGLDPNFAPVARSAVEEFARTHPFWSRAQLLDQNQSWDVCELEVTEFKCDVYEYARATNMGKHLAKLEAMRAMAAWRKERGFGEVLDGWEEESIVEPQISSISLPSPRPPLLNSRAGSPEGSKKRKRSSLREAATEDLSSQTLERDITEAKRLRKMAKKERKKAAREVKEQMGGKQAVNSSEHIQETLFVDTHTPITSSARNEILTQPIKKRKKSMVGPTTSAYFIKPQIPDLISNKEHMTAAQSWTGTVELSKNRKRARKQQKASDRPLPESATSGRTNTSFMVNESAEGAAPAAEETLPAMPTTAPVVPVLVEVNTVGISVEEVRELNKRKPKRKRKRNHNRIPEEQPAQVSDVEARTGALPNDIVLHTDIKLFAEKRFRTQAFVENLQHTGDIGPGDAADDRGGNVNEERGENGPGLVDEPRLKRKRTRHVQTETHDRSQDIEPKIINAELIPLDSQDTHGKAEDKGPKPEPKRKKNRRKERLKDEKSAIQVQPRVSFSDRNQADIALGVEDLPTENEMQLSILDAGTEVETTAPSSGEQHRDRNRNSNGKQKDAAQPEVPQKQGIVAPLAELPHTNSQQPKEDARERGRPRRRYSDKHYGMDTDVPSSREHSKAHHSKETRTLRVVVSSWIFKSEMRC